MAYLYEDAELERLNHFCRGKTIARIAHDDDDDLTLHFTDGTHARLSTLGGIEIEELYVPRFPG